MIQLDADTLDVLIGWAAAPLLLIALVSHIKGFMTAMPWTRTENRTTTTWAPLVLDVLAVGYVKLMELDGRLDVPGTVGWPTVVMLGVALGVVTGKVYDAAWAVRTAR